MIVYLQVIRNVRQDMLGHTTLKNQRDQTIDSNSNLVAFMGCSNPLETNKKHFRIFCTMGWTEDTVHPIQQS